MIIAKTIIVINNTNKTFEQVFNSIYVIFIDILFYTVV
jgi:hypothetical protein